MAETSVSAPFRLFINDKWTSETYLIDRRAAVSVLPLPKISKAEPESYIPYPANGATSKTFGRTNEVFDFNLRRSLQ